MDTSWEVGLRCEISYLPSTPTHTPPCPTTQFTLFTSLIYPIPPQQLSKNKVGAFIINIFNKDPKNGPKNVPKNVPKTAFLGHFWTFFGPFFGSLLNIFLMIAQTRKMVQKTSQWMDGWTTVDKCMPQCSPASPL